MKSSFDPIDGSVILRVERTDKDYVAIAKAVACRLVGRDVMESNKDNPKGRTKSKARDILEAFTGEITDKLGRKYHYVEGKRVGGKEDVEAHTKKTGTYAKYATLQSEGGHDEEAQARSVPHVLGKNMDVLVLPGLGRNGSDKEIMKGDGSYPHEVVMFAVDPIKKISDSFQRNMTEFLDDLENDYDADAGDNAIEAAKECDKANLVKLDAVASHSLESIKKSWGEEFTPDMQKRFQEATDNCRGTLEDASGKVSGVIEDAMIDRKEAKTDEEIESWKSDFDSALGQAQDEMDNDIKDAFNTYSDSIGEITSDMETARESFEKKQTDDADEAVDKIRDTGDEDEAIEINRGLEKSGSPYRVFYDEDDDEWYHGDVDDLEDWPGKSKDVKESKDVLESGFTGIDPHGHKWVDGKQVKRDDAEGPAQDDKPNKLPLLEKGALAAINTVAKWIGSGKDPGPLVRAATWIHDKAEAGFHKLPSIVQKSVTKTLTTAFAGYTASQATAERLAKERGCTDEQAKQLRSVFAALDLAAFKATAGPAAALGPVGVAASWTVPPVTAAYLVAAGLSNPMAAYRTAKGLIGEAADYAKERVKENSKIFESAESDEPHDTEDLANLYAELWLHTHPSKIHPDELGTVHDELSGGTHRLNWDGEKWHTVDCLECDAMESKDDAGHEHKGKGEGGGQFVGSDDGSGTSKWKESSTRTPEKVYLDFAKAKQERDEMLHRASSFSSPITEADLWLALSKIEDGNEPSYRSDVPEELKTRIREHAEKYQTAQDDFHRVIKAIGSKKEAWELTKEEAEFPIAYSAMRNAVKVGDERIFYRVGDLPKSGKSFNTMTGKEEDGVSVYVTPAVGSFAGEANRPWYFGKGKVVGFGGDDEPVIETTGEWSRYPGHEKVVKEALSSGKNVPSEVTNGYPKLKKTKRKEASKPTDAMECMESLDVMESVHRSPKGDGISIKGKHYKPGQFIPVSTTKAR